jgi:polyribonucleotide nucleotidyltransferase
VVGTVTIGSPDSAKVNEARRQIELIVNPPTAVVGQVYPGRVVNITKFGAFVNILPGRDGLVHISKLGRGKRIDRVEDVLELGQPLEVRVDDIDPNGKVSLSPVGWEAEGGETEGGQSRERAPRPAPDSADSVSFEDEFDREMAEAYGDLGNPGSPAPSDDRSRSNDRGGRGRSGGRSGSRSGDRRR